jgi:hypothetical protein
LDGDGGQDSDLKPGPRCRVVTIRPRQDWPLDGSRPGSTSDCRAGHKRVGQPASFVVLRSSDQLHLRSFTQPPGARHSLLIRRNPTTGEYAFYRTYTPHPVPFAVLVKVAGRRWTIEESLAAGKELAALDEHQVGTWTSWHRWTALAILTHAFLSVMTATEPPPGDNRLIRLTRNEIRHVLTAVTAPAHSIEHLIRWSKWRRIHQARARTSHYRRRAP